MQMDTMLATNKKSQNYLEGLRILIIEDDPYTQLLLSRIFTSAGAEVLFAEDGNIGIKMFFEHNPDLIILDIMMPDMDGYSVCSTIRENSSIPIIMVTALNQERDIIRGLDAGANDFLSKPFSQALLLARVQAVVRSSLHFHIEKGDSFKYSDGYLAVNLGLGSVWIEGEPIPCTPKEIDLLNYLIENTDQEIQVEQILEDVWGWEYRGCENYVHIYISKLRDKIERDPRNPAYLVNGNGAGYLFRSSI